MRALIRFNVTEIRGDRAGVLQRMGFGQTDTVGAHVEKLLERADEIFTDVARPLGLLQEITADTFTEVYDGDGANAPSTPLEHIYPRAQALALFAATLGHGIDETIRAFFDRGDPALGYVLDVTAGCAADRLARLTSDRFVAVLAASGRYPPLRALPYSPGYCGWHVSGQRALFECLKPEPLHLSLTSSCLMDPVKSVSGIVVAGSAKVHVFRPAYPFCRTCATRSCAARMTSLREPRS